jgi:periplasmic divalent cation tolerance protein
MTDQKTADPKTVLLCYCTCPDAGIAQHIAMALVDESLAACVSRVAAVHSTYRWEGSVTTDHEELLLIKTTAERFDAMKARLLGLHPYDLPELIAVPIEHAHTNYLDWVRQAVKS